MWHKIPMYFNLPNLWRFHSKPKKCIQQINKLSIQVLCNNEYCLINLIRVEILELCEFDISISNSNSQYFIRSNKSQKKHTFVFILNCIVTNLPLSQNSCSSWTHFKVKKKIFDNRFVDVTRHLIFSSKILNFSI